MPRYLRFLALFHSIARAGTTAPYRSAVLVSIPQLIIVAFSGVTLAMAFADAALAYAPLLISMLVVASVIFEINVRILNTHRTQIEELRRGRRPAWWACLGVYALSYAYAALITVLNHR